MSETIQGSSSSKYIKEIVPGYQDSGDSMTHQSVQDLWSGRGASDVLIHAVYAPSLTPVAIEAGSVRRLIKITGHGASKGDFIRISSGVSKSEEVTILKIVDANSFIISKEINAAIGDTLIFLKPVTPTYNEDGSLNVSIVPSPIAYKLDGVATTVNRDTTTPANTRALPVEIMGSNGTVINLTAGDISIQSSHLGVNYDSIRIGNGNSELDINNAGEALVRDGDAIQVLTDTKTLITTIDGKLPSLGQAVSGSSIPVVLPSAQITALTPPAAITGFALETGNIAAIKTSTDKIPALGQALDAGSVPVVLTASQISTLTPLSSVGVNNFPATQPVSIASSVSVTGTFYQATQPVSGTFYQATQPVSIASMPSTPVTGTFWQATQPVSIGGKAKANPPMRNDYTVTSILTSAYVQVVASMASACTELEIFDSSGQTLVLAVGAAASEVDQVIIIPGGNGRIPLAIASGARVSVKALSASASTGELDINFYN